MSGNQAQPRICLALSSFRNDENVISLLERTKHTGLRELFDEIVVVDSLGTSQMPAMLRARGLSHVHYECAASNLGSAGNLSRRLRFAVELNCDYVFAINHDGELREDTIRRLLAFACHRSNVGAAYPLRYLTARGSYELAGAQRLPTPVWPLQRPPKQEAVRVSWSSSNGALYALQPVRQGLLPDADLWMGWEDMAYGWALETAGFDQFVVTDAIFQDNYEYDSVSLRLFSLAITEKPPWYAYYQTRNLILATRRYRRRYRDYLAVAGRILQEFAVTTLFRREKTVRYGLLCQGTWAGLRNRAGKGPVP